MTTRKDCKNCHSLRRSIKAKGLCSICYLWQRRVDLYVSRINRAIRDPRKYYVKYDASSLPLRVAMAKRVLEEFRWREAGLLADTTDSWRLESLVCIMIERCRSKPDVTTLRFIGRMTPQSRRLMYEVLLNAVENIPTRDPIIHDGWSYWFRERSLSKEGEEQRKLVAALQKAYRDSMVPKR